MACTSRIGHRARLLREPQVAYALRACLTAGVVEARLHPDGEVAYFLTAAGRALLEEP